MWNYNWIILAYFREIEKVFHFNLRLLLHKSVAIAMAAWSSGIVSAWHRGDWSYGSWDRIPPRYREVAFEKEKKPGTIFQLNSKHLDSNSAKLTLNFNSQRKPTYENLMCLNTVVVPMYSLNW
jgi:hypothetical protein